MIDLAGLDKEIDNQMEMIPEPTEARKIEPVKEEISPFAHLENDPLKEEVKQEQKEEEKQEKTPLLHDSKGYCFNPLLHEKNKDGTPRIWKGKLKRKKGWTKNIEQVDRDLSAQSPGQKPDNYEPEPEKIIEPEPLITEETPIDADQMAQMPSHLGAMSNRQLAELITNIFVNAGIAKFGQEWHPIQQPNGKTDRESIVDSWEAYLIHKRAGDSIPLWLRPWLEMGGYWSTRLATGEKTRQGFFSFVGKTKNWLMLRFAYFKGRFTKTEAKTEA